jgi:hypothetical protein
MNRTDKYYLAILVGINLLINYIVLPYAQGTANGHMDAGPAFSFILLLISLIILIVSFRKYLKTKSIRALLISFLLIVNLMYWSYQLATLECFGCLTG